MATLSNKKKQRGGHCSYVTKINNRVDETLENYDTSNEIMLKQPKVILEERLATLQTLDDQVLEMITEEADIEKEIDESGKFREDIHEVMIRINSLLISTAKSEPKVVDTTSGAIKREVQPSCQNWGYKSSEAMRLNGLFSGITTRHQFIRINNSQIHPSVTGP